MKKLSWKKILPHVIAIAVFLIVAIIYSRPAMEGQVLQQTDIVHWKGMAQDAVNYKNIHGHFPLWNTHLFSGMPNYQVDMDGHSFLPDINKIIGLGLPKPASYFFIACVCFYVLSQVFGLNILIGVLVSLAFAYSTYDPIIIVAGHESKMSAIAYMPGLLAGIALVYKRKYLLGLGLTALFATLEIGSIHPQVTYYLLLSLAIMTIVYIVKWIREKQWKHMVISLALVAIGGLIGLGNAAINLWPTYEYAKYTMRGGKTVDATSGGAATQAKTSGLDEDYAFQYSLGKAETLVMMMPNAFGGSSAETLDENSKLVSALVDKGIPENNAIQLASSIPKYWGGINPFTSGPPYIGALICFLAVIGAVVLKGTNKWWLVLASLFAIIIAWGGYLPGLNGLFFKVLPMYNKFRAPSMALIIPQLLLPLLAGLALQKLFYAPNAEEALKKNFKPVLYAAGGLFLLALLVYVFNDYSSSIDNQIVQAYSNPQQGGSEELGRQIVSSIKADRKAMYAAGLGHAFVFGAIVLAALFLYSRKLVKPRILIGAFIIINTADLLVVDSKYLNSDSYQDPDTYRAGNFTPTPADQQILQDKSPHYRVFNLVSGDPFTDALTSYYHRSIGGYHAAKLRIYQDLIESQFGGKAGINKHVLDMLDTKYIIVPAQQQAAPGQAPQGIVQQNPEALGGAWFVKHIRFVESSSAALNALNDFNPKDTAIADNSFKTVIGDQPAFDSTATIQLLKYDNDTIQYKTNARTKQFAVLSEIYYPAGWNAYIDGKKTDYANVDYVLRGIAVPAGQHQLEFRFEPRSVYVGQKIVYASNIAFWLCIGLSVWGVSRKNKKKEA